MALSRKCVKIRVQVKTNPGHTQVLVMPSLIICVDLEKTQKMVTAYLPVSCGIISFYNEPSALHADNNFTILSIRHITSDLPYSDA